MNNLADHKQVIMRQLESAAVKQKLDSKTKLLLDLALVTGASAEHGKLLTELIEMAMRNAFVEGAAFVMDVIAKDLKQQQVLPSEQKAS